MFLTHLHLCKSCRVSVHLCHIYAMCVLLKGNKITFIHFQSCYRSSVHLIKYFLVQLDSVLIYLYFFQTWQLQNNWHSNTNSTIDSPNGVLVLQFKLFYTVLMFIIPFANKDDHMHKKARKFNTQGVKINVLTPTKMAILREIL